MEIDSTGFVNKLKRLKGDLALTVALNLQSAAIEMADEISSRNPTKWRPAVGAYDKYFSGTNKTASNKSDSLFDALDDLRNQISISSDDGNITMGLGNTMRLTSMFGYWDLFEGYGIYQRGRGVRAGKSYGHGFIPASGPNQGGFMKEFIGPESKSISRSDKGNTHPGVLPSFMFVDTAKAFRPIITKRLRKAISLIANRIGGTGGR